MARDETSDSRSDEAEASPPRAGAVLAPHADDLRLATGVVRGDRAAMDEFVVRMRCVPRFAVVCNRQLGGTLDGAALEDVAQDALATIWAKLGTFRGDASLETWVFRITDFTLRNACRKARKNRTTLDGAPEIGVPHPGLAAVDDAEQLRVVIERLPADDAAVLRLKHYEEQTFEQIGRTLDISPNTAKTRYYRALTCLRGYLQQTHGRS